MLHHYLFYPIFYYFLLGRAERTGIRTRKRTEPISLECFLYHCTININHCSTNNGHTHRLQPAIQYS